MAVENLPLASTTTYNVEICQSRSEGVVACPIAGEEQAVSLIRLHSPIEYLSVYWTAIRDGAPPILPSHGSYLQNYNRVFLGGERHGLVFPSLVGHTWVCVGVYNYVINTPEGLHSDFPLAKMPWEDSSTLADFYVPVANIVDGIINPKQLIDYTFIDKPPDVLALNALLR